MAAIIRAIIMLLNLQEREREKQDEKGMKNPFTALTNSCVTEELASLSLSLSLP